MCSSVTLSPSLALSILAAAVVVVIEERGGGGGGGAVIVIVTVVVVAVAVVVVVVWVCYTQSYLPSPSPMLHGDEQSESYYDSSSCLHTHKNPPIDRKREREREMVWI